MHMGIYRKLIVVPTLGKCIWGSWVESDCTATCGKSATRTRHRKKKQEAPRGGKGCSGKQESTVSCNLDECPSK